jgi:signal transduction histidine kinase
MSPAASSQLPHSADSPQRPTSRAQQALDDRKRSFLRLASHELRTPLNSILGFSEILASELYGPLGAPQYREYAEIIQGSGQKLLKLVNQVLEIARLESRTQALDLRPEPLEPAVDEVIFALKDELASHGVSVRVIGRGEMPLVLADPWGLRTVLTNLIQNALVFSPPGGEVRVRAAALERRVDICVEDDGEGVDPADLPRLMQPFEQGENALVRRTEGAGLGLAICELTCRAMGGRLKLHCKPGSGLTATVRLKRA